MAKKATTKSAKPVSKSELLARLANKTGLSRKQVASVFDGLTGLIGEGLGNRGPGTFVIPGLVKLQVQHKPAVAEHPGKNPFTTRVLTPCVRSMTAIAVAKYSQ